MMNDRIRSHASVLNAGDTSYLCRPYQPGLRSIMPSPMTLPGSYQSPHTAINRKPIERSNTQTKKVPLYNGNLVLDCPVPSRLLDASARKEKEFSMMRYSAVTCDPDEFAKQGYTLRPTLMNRQTELFIVMTMYNVKQK